MDSKGKGALSYLLSWLGGLIVLFALKDNTKKDVMHAGQAIVIGVADLAGSIVIGIVSGILAALTGFGGLSYLSYIVSLLCIVLRIMGLVKALQDADDPKLPVVGDLTEKLFAKKLAEAPATAGAAVTPKFDPNTGKPVNAQPQANFDPNTGRPVNEAAPSVEQQPEDNNGQNM